MKLSFVYRRYLVRAEYSQLPVIYDYAYVTNRVRPKLISFSTLLLIIALLYFLGHINKQWTIWNLFQLWETRHNRISGKFANSPLYNHTLSFTYVFTRVHTITTINNFVCPREFPVSKFSGNYHEYTLLFDAGTDGEIPENFGSSVFLFHNEIPKKSRISEIIN